MNKKEEWNELYDILKEAYCDGETNTIANEDRFNPTNLKNASLGELEDLYEELEDVRDAIHTFNELQHEEGWEHNWDD